MIIKWMFIMILCIIGISNIFGRPAVRNLRTHEEFTRLIKYHKQNTGMGVIIDYYSDGCGPCRQIAPHYLELAKRYKDQVVFAKVDVNGNHETSSRQMIRSMPTFQFYMNGKKVHQFSGGDLQQLQVWASKFAKDYTDSNVRVSPEDLMAFYKEFAPEKATEEQVNMVITKAGGENGGKGHKSLMKALKKKYGKAPKSGPRILSADDNAQKKKEPTGKAKEQTNQAAPQQKCELSQFDSQALQDELLRRQEEAEPTPQELEEEENEAEKEHMFEVWKPSGLPELVVIVGGGPAGLSAAIYAARSGLRPLVVAPTGGGQLQGKGVLVENYPGVVDATGPAVVFAIQQQAAKYGTVFLEESVTNIKLSTDVGGVHKITTNSTTIEAHTLIMATGAESRWLGIPGEEVYRGGGVSTCATCDGFLYRDLPVVVIGGGDTAMEEALHLATTSSHVTVIHRRDDFSKASNVLASRVLNHPKISVMWNTKVVEFRGHKEETEEPQLTHVYLQNSTSGDFWEHTCSGAFIAIGHDPATGLVKGQMKMNNEGYIEVEGSSTRTSVPGVFAAGDVADHVYRQAITSAGTGAMAALDAEHYILENGIRDDREAADDNCMQEVLAEGGN